MVTYSWWEGVECGCLQTDDSGRFVVAVDGHVWEVTEREFTAILTLLGEQP